MNLRPPAHLRPAAWIVVLALAAAAGNASAALYRCEVDGRTTYSDRPCGTVAQRPAPAGPVAVTPQVPASRGATAAAPPPSARLSAQDVRRIRGDQIACIERGIANWQAGHAAPPATEARTRKLAELTEACSQEFPLPTKGATPPTSDDVAKLKHAIDMQDAGTLAVLLRDGANANADLDRAVRAKAKEVRLPALNYALHRGCVICTKVLLAAGADPNFADRSGDYPLHTAIAEPGSAHELALVVALVNAGARTEVKNRRGETPAMLARRLGRLETVGALQASP